MNLDKLLKKVEKNTQELPSTTTPYVVDGETYEVLPMTRKQKRDFIYSQKIGNKEMVAGDLIKSMIPTIYNCFQLKDIATRAKDDGLIIKYHDIVEALFEPEELLNIVAFLVEANNLGDFDKNEEINEIKK